MKNSIFVLMVIVFGINCLEMDPPLWPQHFSQSFEVQTSYSNQTGRMWHDFTNGKFRYDFDHPDGLVCENYAQYKSECTQLWSQAEGKMYIILPEEELCCYFQSSDMPPRDWLKVSNYIFTGEVYLDGQYFYRWQRFNFTHFEYLADKSEKMIPKRDERDRIIFDFWLDSYNDSPISPSVFNVPNYCVKPCGDHDNENQRNSHKFRLRKIQDLVETQIQNILKKE